MHLRYVSRNFAVMPQNPHELLSVTQAAKLLHAAPRTVHHWLATNRLAGTKVGDGATSAYVITRTEVTRFISERDATRASA